MLLHRLLTRPAGCLVRTNVAAAATAAAAAAGDTCMHAGGLVNCDNTAELHL
jgi:hypothetical protein